MLCGLLPCTAAVRSAWHKRSCRRWLASHQAVVNAPVHCADLRSRRHTFISNLGAASDFGHDVCRHCDAMQHTVSSRGVFGSDA